MSSEGQADYYATSLCFREFVEHENKIRPTPLQVADFISDSSVVSEKCAAQWGFSSSENQLCQRAARGSLSFLKLVFDFKISFDTPSTALPNQTLIDEYPSRQCRLDTLFSGALCTTKFPLKFDFNNAFSELCLIDSGKRPRCWFTK